MFTTPNYIKNKWYASQSEEPGTASVWELIGTCSTSSLETPPSPCPTNSSPWNSTLVYNSSNTYVTHEGLLYYNKWYASAGQTPGNSNVWEVERACSQNNANINLADNSNDKFVTAEKESNTSFKVYPNPWNGRDLTLNFLENMGNVDIKILTINGEVVYDNKINAKGKYKLSLNRKLNRSIYILSIEHGEKSYHKKLVVQ